MSSRRQSRHLDGDVWIPVQIADDPLARRTLRIYTVVQPSNPSEVYSGRIVALPGEEVAVFLGSTFMGLLPPESARVVRPIAQEADAADQKLQVKLRIAGDDAARTLAVALP
jgi:hypothetical protein